MRPETPSPDSGPEGTKRWSRLAWRELRALELRDEEHRQAAEANGKSCCRFWRGVPYIGGGRTAHRVLHCPACGERLRDNDR